MTDFWIVVIGLLIPFAGTTLGAAMSFFLKKEMNVTVQKLLLGFAAGVMIAASIWSLLIPALEMTVGPVKWWPSAIGFLLGVGFLLILDNIIPHLHLNTNEPEWPKKGFEKDYHADFSCDFA